jgi:hypothetical protein
LAAEAMLALILEAGIVIEWLESTDKVARLRMRRGGVDHVEVFTIEDARRAGLAGGNVWKSYPKAMLRARCISSAARAFCPDVTRGCYTKGEISEALETESAPVVVSSKPASEPELPAHPMAAELAELGDVDSSEALQDWCSRRRFDLANLENGDSKRAMSEICLAARRIDRSLTHDTAKVLVKKIFVDMDAGPAEHFDPETGEKLSRDEAIKKDLDENLDFNDGLAGDEDGSTVHFGTSGYIAEYNPRNKMWHGFAPTDNGRWRDLRIKAQTPLEVARRIEQSQSISQEQRDALKDWIEECG